jgi:phosphoribosylpyrophosphate synthetase
VSGSQFIFVVVTITFEFSSYTVEERDGVAMVCLIKDVQTSDSIIIDDITTSPGTATG